MPFIPEQQLNLGFFIPVTQIWADQARLHDVDVNTDEFKNLLVSLYQNIGNMAIALNAKDTGLYLDSIFVNSQQFFNPADRSPLSYRADFRLLVNFGTLPNAGTKSVAHNIPIATSGYTYTFTRIYATASDPIGLNYIPIPYASPTSASNIELSVDATNVNITTGSDRTNFTVCYVILEFLQS